MMTPEERAQHIWDTLVLDISAAPKASQEIKDWMKSSPVQWTCRCGHRWLEPEFYAAVTCPACNTTFSVAQVIIDDLRMDEVDADVPTIIEAKKARGR